MEENTINTALECAENNREAEYDLVKSLLEAANYKEDVDTMVVADIKRRGELLFSVHLHPISDADARFARRKATTFMPNPDGKRLPPIEKEFNNAKFGNWLIYLATTEEDQRNIWGNPAIMQKFSLAEPYEAVDILLTLGEKRRLLEIVTEISGMDDEDEVSEEDFAKN